MKTTSIITRTARWAASSMSLATLGLVTVLSLSSCASSGFKINQSPAGESQARSLEPYREFDDTGDLDESNGHGHSAGHR